MQYTVTPTKEVSAPRRAAVNALAIVGFIALVFIGIALAIYAARFVPGVLTRIGNGFGLAGAGESNLVVVDEPLVIEFEPETPVVVTPATTTPAKPVATTPKPAGNPTQVIGYRTVITDYETPGSVRIEQNGTANLYGDANLTTRITAVGYVDSRGDNFRSDSSIDTKDRLAVKFTVTNTGTNKTGSWKLRATLPTKTDRTFDYTSKTQQSLNPGDKIDFIVYVNKGDTRKGDNQEIVINADSGNDVRESNERDNRDTVDVDID